MEPHVIDSEIPEPALPSADQFDVYTGNANPELARNICRYLGIDLGRAEVFEFANENIFVRIIDNAREKDVFLIQPTSRPVNQSIMELLIMIDAFKRASAGRITAVVPYYGYGRSDKKDQPRVPITARLIADMMTVAGANRLLTVDLHQGQIQGFFNIPVDELTAVHLLSSHFRQKEIENLVVVTDLGFAKRARTFAQLLDAPLAIVEKRRIGNQDRAEVLNVIGDVRKASGRSSSTTRSTPPAPSSRSSTPCQREGVTEMYACATHAVLSDPAVERIEESSLREVVVTDSIPIPPEKRGSKIKVISLAPLIAEAILRIHRGQSVGALFTSEVKFTQEMLLWDVDSGAEEPVLGGNGRSGASRRASTSGGRARPKSSLPRWSRADPGGGRQPQGTKEIVAR
jgi:ribose-phosphate pyrophosphokinase